MIESLLDGAIFSLGNVNAENRFTEFAGFRFPPLDKKIYYSKPTAPSFMRTFIL